MKTVKQTGRSIIATIFTLTTLLFLSLGAMSLLGNVFAALAPKASSRGARNKVEVDKLVPTASSRV